MAAVHNARVLRQLQVGDMVEFPRNYLYSHWGVYLGDEKIVHLTGYNPLGMFSICGVAIGEGAVVKIENFWTVADGCKAKINNNRNRHPRPSDEIVTEAYSLAGHADFHVLWNNCEHFASYLRYGKKSYNKGILATVVIGGAAVAVGGFVGGIMAGALFVDVVRNVHRNNNRPSHQ